MGGFKAFYFHHRNFPLLLVFRLSTQLRNNRPLVLNLYVIYLQFYFFSLKSGASLFGWIALSRNYLFSVSRSISIGEKVSC